MPTFPMPDKGASMRTTSDEALGGNPLQSGDPGLDDGKAPFGLLVYRVAPAHLNERKMYDICNLWTLMLRYCAFLTNFVAAGAIEG